MQARMTLRAIPGGDAGVLSSTLPTLAALVRSARAQPEVRNAAAYLVAHCRGDDSLCRQARLYKWVKRNVRFVPDPRKVELIQEPRLLLASIARHGWAAGDCDDMTALLASLLEAVGTKTRLVVVATDPGPVRRLRHVYVEAQQTTGAWLRLDPLGERFPPAGFTRRIVVEV